MDYVSARIAWSESILADLAAQIGLPLPRILSGAVIILLFLALAGHLMYPTAIVALFTGMRLGEILALPGSALISTPS